MAVRENWKTRAARVGEELTETGRVVLHAPVLVRSAECVIRFLLGAVLSGGEVFGGFAPFGVGMVACSGAGLDGLFSLLGASFGYLAFRGFTEGLRYVAACVLVFSVAFAFFDAKFYKKAWFMPAVAAFMDAATGFVYLSDADWRPAQVVWFLTEVLLAGASAYFYRLAFSSWTGKREQSSLTARQTVSVFFLLGSLLITLAGVTFLGGLSVGRLLAALAAMTVAHAGGLGLGAAVGVAAGLGMDLAAGGAPFYSMAYAFSGLLTGAGWKQGRLFAALTYVVTNAAVVLWTWDSGVRISSLYEVFIASVIFLLLPQRLLRRISALLVREKPSDTAQRAAEYAQKKLADAAGAFREVYATLRASFPPREPNDADASCVFDRAAERVCRSCALRGTCWEHGYENTFTALNDVLPVMLDRGRAKAGDFPGWFTGRCLKFPAFLQAANEEMSALLYRRQYAARIRESRGAVCREYGTLADVLTGASAELGAELTADPIREKKLRQHLTGLGVEAVPSAFYDAAGHLRVEIGGESLEPLRREEEQKRMSELLGMPLRRAEEDRLDRVVLVQDEPLMALAGVAAKKKEGQTESGDAGTWFKREDGSLFILLCDGMGSGLQAARESALAIRLLEQFLKAGVETLCALRTVNAALALRGEETGAFSTVDLLRVDLFTGEGELYKYGAAPTYVKKGGGVSRVSGAALPAGLTDGDGVSPDVTRLRLGAGDCVLLLTDGVTGGDEDVWVREKLAAFDGRSPKDLAREVMEESTARGGGVDDRTAVAVELGRRE